jgi:hypothetical protein
VTLLAERTAQETPRRTPARRGRSLPLIAVLLVLTGVVASTVLAAPRAASFAEISPAATGAPYVTVPEYGVRGARVLGYVDGATVRISLPVHNTGRLPVTLTGVGLDGGLAPLLAVQSVDGLPRTVLPGRSTTVQLTALLANCRFFHEREIQVYDAVRVEFRSLGRYGVETIRFDRPVLVRSPPLPSCPDRKLDRQANDRRDLL